MRGSSAIRKSLRRRACAVSVLLLAASCGGGADEPLLQPGGGELLACQVTGDAGVQDGGFEAQAREGLRRAGSELPVRIDLLESASPQDYGPNVRALIERGCRVIVAVSPTLAETAITVAQEHPEVGFIVMDPEGDVRLPNVRNLTFRIEQAAFLAGHAAARLSETRTVATFGSLNIPGVTEAMAGFAAGARFRAGKQVDVLGWPTGGGGATFVRSLAHREGRRTASRLIRSGADVIFPATLGHLDVARGATSASEGREDVRFVWSGPDGCESAPQVCSRLLTSVTRNVDVAVFEAVGRAARRGFAGGVYEGTLENGGVGIAPLRSIDDEVADRIEAELEELRRALVEGTIAIEELA